MTNSPSIAPPPELVQRWLSEFYDTNTAPGEATLNIASRAATWGADQELEACCEWMAHVPDFYTGSEIDLRSARRPKTPSLKEQALKDLEQIDGYAVDQLSAYVIYGDLKRQVSNIRQALEQLPND